MSTRHATDTNMLSLGSGDRERGEHACDVDAEECALYIEAILRISRAGREGWAEIVNDKILCRPNGPEVNPRGQGPRGYGSAAHGLPARESRDAGRAPPFRF
jgi:hypothetical protein